MTALDDLITGKTDPATFTHADHVVVGYQALQRFEVFEAMQVVASGLRGLADRAGCPEKFNATVTFAFLSQIAQRMTRDDRGTAEGFLASHPDLLGRDALGGRYSKSLLNSDLARAVPVLPDRAALATGGRQIRQAK